MLPTGDMFENISQFVDWFLQPLTTPTKNISWFVDWFLRLFTTSYSSYIPDTTDILNRLRRLPVLPRGTLLVTLGVSSLYTYIPHKEGTTACEEFLNLQDYLVPSTADPCHLIRLILTKNYFSFNGNCYSETCIRRLSLGPDQVAVIRGVACL